MFNERKCSESSELLNVYIALRCAIISYLTLYGQDYGEVRWLLFQLEKHAHINGFIRTNMIITEEQWLSFQ